MGSLVAELAEKLSSATNNFDIDSGTIYVNTSADTVGIGTTTPGSKLDVQGTMQVGVDDTGHDVKFFGATAGKYMLWDCLLYTSPSPRDKRQSRMPSSA